MPCSPRPPARAATRCRPPSWLRYSATKLSQSCRQRRRSNGPGRSPAATGTCSFVARSTSSGRSWPCDDDCPGPLSIPDQGANMQHVSDQRFYRSSNRILGGVCAGLAEGFHVDALWVRIAFLFLVFLQGLGLFIYIVLWLVMPERLEGGDQRSGFDAMMVDVKRIWGELQHQLRSGSRPAASTPGSTPAPAPASTDSPQRSAGPAPTHAGWRDPTVLFG